MSEKKQTPPASVKQLELEILFEDRDIVCVQKPAGVVVNDATTVKGDTVQSWMRRRFRAENLALEDDWRSLVPSDFSDEFGTPAEIFEKRVGMVHRLDKDTSGVLILAKNPGSLVSLLAQFRLRHVSKKYLCLVHGVVKEKEGVLDFPLGRARSDRKKFAVVPDGRSASTSFVVEERFQGLDKPQLQAEIRAVAQDPVSFFKQADRIYQGFSLVQCLPHTGRTHQIRVHLAHIQHPLVGDTTYVGRKRAQLDPVWCPRHFLHAESLTFVHPRTGREQTVVAPLSTELEKVLELMKKEN